MWFQLIIFAIYIIFVLYLRNRIKKRKSKKQWNPFKLWEMITIIKRKDETTFERQFKRFEYVGQETEEGEIIGIYFVRTRQKSKKELKYEKLIEKWR